jgi:predicted DNA binding CopG/RHH family protein
MDSVSIDRCSFLRVTFNWDPEKNVLLERRRGISSEETVVTIEDGAVLDVLSHPNQDRYGNQQIYLVEHPDYVFAVPFVRDEWVPVTNLPDAIAEACSIATATLKKDRRMNIRISDRDLKSLKARAAEEGIPYQTLVTSVLHKYVSGRLIEKAIIEKWHGSRNACA